MENKVCWNTSLPTRNFYPQSRAKQGRAGLLDGHYSLLISDKESRRFSVRWKRHRHLAWVFLWHLDVGGVSTARYPAIVTVSSPGSQEAASMGQACSAWGMCWLKCLSMMGDTLTPRRPSLGEVGLCIDKVMTVFCVFSYWVSFCSPLIFKCYLFWKDIKRKEVCFSTFTTCHSVAVTVRQQSSHLKSERLRSIIFLSLAYWTAKLV